MTRLESHQRIVRLREAGLDMKEIARHLGLSKSTVYAYYTDPSGDRDRERKKKRFGLCKGCGTRTYDGGSEPPERCLPCHREHERTLEYRRSRALRERNIRWSDAEIFAAIRSIARDGKASMGDYNRAYARRRRGSMPSMPLITRRFDTWSAAVHAAGLETKHATRGPRWDRVSREGCLLSLVDCIADLDRLPTYSEYQEWAKRVGGINAQTVRIRCGTWMDAIEAAAAETGVAA